jgi:hypothetical protein
MEDCGVSGKSDSSPNTSTNIPMAEIGGWNIKRFPFWAISPSGTLMLTITGFVASYAGVIDGIIFFIGAVILLAMQFTKLILAVYRHVFNSEKIIQKTEFGSIAACLTLVLLLTNMKTVDHVHTYVLVWTLERHLQNKAETAANTRSISGNLFKYFRLPFGKAMASRRWIVYDESNQVSLDYQDRTADWWRVSQELQEFEACTTNGVKLHSNFYVQYSGC